MTVIEFIEQIVSTTDGCFSGGATLDVLDQLKKVADLNMISFDKATKRNIEFILEEAFPFLKIDFKVVKFAFDVAESAANWVKNGQLE